MAQASPSASTSYKKQDGNLSLSSDRKSLIWSPNARGGANAPVVIAVAEITSWFLSTLIHGKHSRLIFDVKIFSRHQLRAPKSPRRWLCRSPTKPRPRTSCSPSHLRMLARNSHPSPNPSVKPSKLASHRMVSELVALQAASKVMARLERWPLRKLSQTLPDQIPSTMMLVSLPMRTYNAPSSTRTRNYASASMSPLLRSRKASQCHNSARSSGLRGYTSYERMPWKRASHKAYIMFSRKSNRRMWTGPLD